MFDKRRSFIVKFELKPSLVFVSLLSLLISLGIWQLNRAEQKREIMRVLATRMAQENLQLSVTVDDKKDELRYRKVAVTGHYDATHSFLIDNQMSDGKPGYLVLTPFVLKGASKAVLVNRGWLPLNQNRKVLPKVTVNEDETVITGRINDFPGVGIKLNGGETPTDTLPPVVQFVDSTVLAEKFKVPLFSFQIELDKDLPNGFKRHWQTVLPMPPEKHSFYALQWFALALTLTVLFIAFSLKKLPS